MSPQAALFDYDAYHVAKALYPEGARFHAEHPEATEHLIERAKEENVTRDARISKLMEDLLEDPARWGLVAGNGRIYGSDRNSWPPIARYLELVAGVRFTKRKARCDGMVAA